MGYNLKVFIRETLSKLTGKKELKWPVYLCKQQSAYTLSYKLIYSFEYYFKIAFFPVFQLLKNIFMTKRSVLILRSQ